MELDMLLILKNLFKIKILFQKLLDYIFILTNFRKIDKNLAQFCKFWFQKFYDRIILYKNINFI